MATERLVGPVDFRFLFGGGLSPAFPVDVVDATLRGFGTAPSHPDRPA